MNRLTADRVRDHATALGLAHTAASLSQALERAEAAGSGYLDFLDALLGEELGVRESRRFAAALARSGLPHHRRLSDFDFAFQPGLDVRRIRDLGTCEFVKNKQNVLFLGPPGVGKTMLAVALAVAACEAGFSIYFTTLEDAIRRLSAAQATGRFTTQLRAYQRPHLLVLDEVGYQKLRPEQANMLFQLVSRRYETGSIILSSNKALI